MKSNILSNIVYKSSNAFLIVLNDLHFVEKFDYSYDMTNISNRNLESSLK